MNAKAENNPAKPFLIAGAIFGGAISLVISVMMDFMFSDTLQGTWRDAIVKDMDKYFSMTISPDSALAYILFIVTLILMAVIGAAMGAACAYVIHKFLSLLAS